MNCPNCNVMVSFKKNHCDNCGQDLVMYRKIVSLSNMYYNDGLSRAKVRDLSGAIVSLKKSLQFNKKNTPARNLLGLVYYETGEVVAALSEWVISKYFQSEKNDADLYINAIQSNPNRLETINQTIKKYNAALASAKQGDEDMAIIQLKKVVSISPKFIRAHQLLALLYMMTAEYEEGNREKAAKCLQKIIKVDMTNTVTLCYMKELGLSPSLPSRRPVEKEREEPPRRKVLPRDDTAAFTPVANAYKEEKPSVLPFINVIVGVLIGLDIAYFLILPQARGRLQKENTNDFKNYSEELAEAQSQVTTEKKHSQELEEQVESLQAELEGLTGEGPAANEAYEETYRTFFKAVRQYMNGQEADAVQTLEGISESDLTVPAAKKIYKKITAANFEETSTSFFEEGRDEYNRQCSQSTPDFTKAEESLNKALEYNSENCDAMYFLGRVCQRKSEIYRANEQVDEADEQMEKAKEYYNTIINDYPENERASQAASRLREMD